MVQSVTYQSEKQSVYFQGKLIVLENLIPVLSPDEKNKRKREIENHLYEVCAGTGADALMRDILEMRGCQRYNIVVRLVAPFHTEGAQYGHYQRRLYIRETVGRP